LDTSALKTLVIVDANQLSRLGQVAELTKRPGIEIDLFDHHKTNECDIEASKRIFAEYGSNTTLMVEHLRQKGIEPSKEELTLMLLGIYHMCRKVAR